MPYDGKLLARARAELDGIKADNLALRLSREEEVYAQVPELRRIDEQMRAQMAELVRLTISRRPDIKEKVDALGAENLALQRRRVELLRSIGRDADYLDEIYSCPKCRDSGVFQGGVCSCLEKLYNAELTRELGTLMRDGEESFERFDLRLYPLERDPVKNVVPREAMAMVLSGCKRFAEGFSPASPNLLLQGGTGLGKTYLSACIARVVAQRGFSVCYDSASVALEAFERAKFSRDTAEGEAAALRVRRMLDCDLMILDDLGTEMVTAMSMSALYSLLNTRLTGGRKTIVSTNLTDEELQKKYSPQIFSRLTGEFMCLPFVGRDIRRMKR